MIASLGAVAAVPASQAAAQTGAEPSAAERCFEHHGFGAQPVDVAKSADGLTVLAQVSWGYHDAIGCYLTLDDDALAALQAAPAPQSLPDAATDASRRCFEHHQFGERPVDVAKTADGQTVLARLSWGHQQTIGCYLVLDDAAIAAGAFHSCAIRTDNTIACWGWNEYGQLDAPGGTYTAIAAGRFHSCAIRTDNTIACWDWTTNLPAGVVWVSPFSDELDGTTTAEAEMARLVNQLRQRLGLAPLTYNAGFADVARGWSRTMRDTG